MADKNEAMENLFKAIDIITAERLSNLGYDKTIKATITDDSQSAQGRYVLTDGSSTFDASCNPDTVYKKDMIVYVIIPEGNWDNEKLIVGKYSNKGDDYYNYANPSDDFLDVTHNLISDVDAQSLLANSPDRPYVRVWSCDGVEYKGYNRLALKGNFRTWLSSLDVMKGTYGLVLYVVSKESLYDTGDFERTHKFDLFTTDMYGDPFNFETYYLQEKVFDISGLSNIVHMELLLVQNSDFYNVDNQLVAYEDKDGNAFPDNIFVQQPYVSLGYDLNDVTQDEVKLYTLDSETYDATYNEDNIRKTMDVRWIHIQEDGVPVAIDQEDEIPTNSVIRWYKYVLDRTVADKMAGALWEEIEEARNTFSYSFVPDILVSSEKFKVIVESPSREAIIKQLEESEFGDFTGIEIEDKEGQTILDSTVLINALNSYNDNSLLSFQEYKQIILEYNAKYQIEHQRDYPNYEKAILILDNIQRAQSDVCIYRSDILEFENESYDPVAAAIDLISGLTILVDAAGYNGSYLLYDDSGMITNAAESVRKRVLTATYQSLITGEEILDKAEKIVWYFPIEGSMIYPPQLGTEYSEYEVYSELTDEEIATLELPCKYCRIERAIPEVLEGDAGDEVMRQTEQYFRIKDYYTQTATNNTIYCTVFKNGKQYQAEATLIFGVSGTCGTDATFLLQMREWDEENQRPTDHPVQALTLGKSVAIVPKFYDYNNNDITDEYLASHTVNYAWHTQPKTSESGLQLIPGQTNPRWARITVDSGADISKCKYYILSATVYWSIIKYQKDEWGRTVLDAQGQPVIDEEQKDIEARDVQLKTFLPIPVRSDDKYTQVVGPTQIIYNKDGTNPTYYDAPFVLYEDGEEREASWMMACREYIDSGTDAASRDTRILNYYPALDANGKLTPKNMYLSDGQPFAVEAIVNNQVIWTQPILIIKNKYTSAMLNSWDGELCIDQENGTIMSTMVGAGIKDVNNTFTGVLMGDVAAGAGFDERNHKGIGIYGFHQSDQSFGFNVDGTAFIGKAGRGRISMDGNKGTIQSGVYEKNVAGMQIDLDGDDSTSAALFAYGDGGAFELNTNASRALLEIRNGASADSPILFHIGKPDADNERKFYLQSANYDGSSKGTKLDLNKGTIDIYHEGGSFIKMDGDGTPYLQIHDGSTAYHSEGTDVFIATTSKYQLMSINYTAASEGVDGKGCFIDLQRGEVEARKGIIGGWNIDANKIYAGNIELRAEGSMYGGTESNPWYIDKSGNASFTTITAAKGGQIGPFTISDTALYIGSAAFKSATVYLGTSGVSVGGKAFSASGTTGDVYIGGALEVAGDTTLNGTLTVKSGKIIGGSTGGGGGSGGGGGGGGGYLYDFEGDSATIGPWTIDAKGINAGDGDSKTSIEPGGTMKLVANGGYIQVGTMFTYVSDSKGPWIQVSDDRAGIGANAEGTYQYLKITSGETMLVGDADNYLKLTPAETLLAGSTTNYLKLTSSEMSLHGGSTTIDFTKDAITVDGYTCTGSRQIEIKFFQSLKAAYINVYKGFVVDESVTGDGGTGGDSGAQKGLGDLAWADYVSKKVDVTLTGTVSVSYPGGGGGTVYVYEDDEGYYRGWGWNESNTYTNHSITISGSSGGSKNVKVQLSKEFTADFYPSEADDTETFSFTADSATTV